MRCSDCGKHIKPVVAVDIDGTMGGYHKHFLNFAAAYLNRHPHYHYVGQQPFKEWFCMTYRCTPDDWHDIKLAYRQGGMKRTMGVYPDAAELCKAIRDAGAELWVTTTRPYIRHDNIDPDTREWLRRNGIKYDYLIYDGHKYEKLKQLVGKERVCAILDDLDEEIIEAHNLFGGQVPIFRLNDFNSAARRTVGMLDPEPMQARNLDMAMRLILDRIRAWRTEHDDRGSYAGDGSRSVRNDGEQDSAASREEVPGEVS